MDGENNKRVQDSFKLHQIIRGIIRAEMKQFIKIF
jgi:hypothetical protein